MRESTSLYMIPHLVRKGARVHYYDPSGEKKSFFKNKNIIFCKNIEDACNNADLVVIHTEWEEFKALNFRKLSKGKSFKIFDLRNLYSTEGMKKKGLKYFSIGR